MKKARKKKFDKGTEARRVARNSGIAPANTKVIADKRKRPPKHKKKWLEEPAVEQGIQPFQALRQVRPNLVFRPSTRAVGRHGFVRSEQSRRRYLAPRGKIGGHVFQFFFVESKHR